LCISGIIKEKLKNMSTVIKETTMDYYNVTVGNPIDIVFG
jgi:hypothetical protein